MKRTQPEALRKSFFWGPLCRFHVHSVWGAAAGQDTLSVATIFEVTDVVFVLQNRPERFLFFIGAHLTIIHRFLCVSHILTRYY